MFLELAMAYGSKMLLLQYDIVIKKLIDSTQGRQF
jgi:hypothetical protein